MGKFLTTSRAAMIPGKGRKPIENGPYCEALERSLKADQLALDSLLSVLHYSIEGNSRYHLGDHAETLAALREA